MWADVAIAGEEIPRLPRRVAAVPGLGRAFTAAPPADE
ncbi:hypothetical protein P186_2533 [Pyrobaculum ferrireducens]|uniref:Uncharacterized protein n=1 Tax=Pyrobaculum ferrireducens TaxID=1104324 RepID=G7VD40_9CREN|nr:hypothetical protein P186_2533 [Pyrobaculum ferrireducens]